MLRSRGRVYESLPSDVQLQNLGVGQGSQTSANKALEYDQGLLTRRLCIGALGISYGASIACIVGGSLAHGYTPSETDSHQSSHCLRFSDTTRAIIPLCINIGVLVITEGLGMIHSTSLKWALFQEDRLEFNANLRLLTFSDRNIPNGRFLNMLYFLTLVLCYASSPLIIVAIDLEGTSETLCFSKSGPLTLGICILVQAFICTWCLFATEIPTWSTNPLVTVAVALVAGKERQLGRCMVAVHDVEISDTSKPRKPQRSQKSAYNAKKYVIWVLYLVCASLVAFIIWGIVVIAVSAHNEAGYNNSQHIVSTWSFFPVYGSYIDDVDELAPYARVTPSAVLTFFQGAGVYYTAYLSEGKLFAVLLFTSVIQAVITLGTHCAELQVIMARDEAAWRRAASQTGADSTAPALKTALTSWRTLLLLAFKPTIHWIYGLAMTADYVNGLWMLGPQIIYLACLWFAFMMFALFVSLQRPAGPIPATYGHVQTLVNLIDEWSPHFYWGEKTQMSDEVDGITVYHAGTSTTPLPPVDMDRFYMG